MKGPLLPAPIALEGIEATAARSQRHLRSLGFYERQKRGLGSFIDRERLEKRQPFFLSDALRGIRGVRIIRTSDGRHLAIASRGSGSSLNKNCAMPICPAPRRHETASAPARDTPRIPRIYIPGASA